MDFLTRFQACERYLRDYLLAATGSPHEADDLLQELSALLWERFETYDERRPFQAWATGYARMEVLKWRQRIARRRLVLSADAMKALADTAGDVEAEPDPWSRELNLCVLELAEPARELLRLHYVEAMPIALIAERTGKTVGAVEMALVRTRRALRERVSRKVLEAGD